jgi:hypothetical protein
MLIPDPDPAAKIQNLTGITIGMSESPPTPHVPNELVTLPSLTSCPCSQALIVSSGPCLPHFQPALTPPHLATPTSLAPPVLPPSEAQVRISLGGLKTALPR